MISNTGRLAEMGTLSGLSPAEENVAVGGVVLTKAQYFAECDEAVIKPKQGRHPRSARLDHAVGIGHEEKLSDFVLLTKGFEATH